MKKTLVILGATLVLALGTIALIAQQREGQRGGGPPPPMSFFITSVGIGDGANYGGLAGADAYCQMMAASAGRVTEKAGIVNGVGDMPNTHDILTGSQADGRAYTDSMDHTCSNYSSNADGRGQVQLGHSDKQGGNNSSWNSTHGSRGCSQPNLVSTGGAGLLYCFAVN